MQSVRWNRAEPAAPADSVPGLCLLPRTMDTRRREAAAVARLARRSQGVIISSTPGEGRASVARAAAARLGIDDLPQLVCGHHTTAQQLGAWYRSNVGLGYLLLRDADLLGADTIDVLGAMTADPETCLLLTCTDKTLDEVGPDLRGTAAEFIVASWQRHRLAHVRLGPLSPEELAVAAAPALEDSGLDSLQLGIIVYGSRGSLVLATDLAEDAAAAPERVPRHLAAAWNESFPMSAPTRSRILEKLGDLPPDVVEAVRHLHPLGSIDNDVVSTLLGHELHTRLAGSSALLSHRSHTLEVDLLTSSVLHSTSSALSETPSLVHRMDQARRAGVTLPPGCTQTLAEHRILRGDTNADAELFLAAGRSATRLGQPERALQFARVAAGIGTDRREQPIEWYAKLQLNLQREVLDDAAEFWQEHPEKITLDHLYCASIAASWSPEVPDWLCRYLDTQAHRDVAEILNVLLERQPLDAPAAHRLGTVGSDPSAPIPVRQSAFALALIQALREGDPQRLERLVVRARTFSGALQEVLTADTGVSYNSRLVFDQVLTTARLVSGTGLDGILKFLREANLSALGYEVRSGRQAGVATSFMNCVFWLVLGNPSAAARDHATTMATMDRCMFRPVNALLADFGSLFEPGKQYETEELRGRHLFLTRRDGVQGEPAESWLPTWFRLFPAAAALRGNGPDAQAGAELLVAQLPDRLSPSPAAIRTYLQAKTAQDPESLYSAAGDLLTTGQTALGLDALEGAKELFLLRRSAVRARDCLLEIERLTAGSDSGPPYTEPSGTPPQPVRPTRPGQRGRHPMMPATAEPPSAPPAGLSSREFEVCLLVAEGLNNPQIAEKLVLSVRTVESHVFQARTKLGAGRRREIPELLHKALCRPS